MAKTQTRKGQEVEQTKSDKFYTVIAGRFEPEELQLGRLNPTTGLPDGKTQSIKVAVGSIMIPNYSRVWGRRVNEESTEKSRSLEVTDKSYKGKIDFLPFGDDRGELLEIRWLPTSKSLDKQYQDQIQKLGANADENPFLYLEQGTNDYDPMLQSTLINMLKYHTLNPDNESRDQNKTDFMFVEYSAATRKNKMQKIAIRREAEAIVLDAEKDSLKLKVLANIFSSSMNPKEQDDILVDKLFAKVESDPHNFLEVIQNYRKGVQDVMLYLIEEELLFVEDNEDKIQLIMNGRKEIILNNVEGDDKLKKIMWVVNHILEPNTFEAVAQMESVKKDALATAQ